MTQPLACLVLAAGKGTRMKSRLPKLLHTACGRPLLGWSLAAVEPLGADPAVVIVPPDQPELDALVPGWASTAVQHSARGTGDAVLAGREALSGFAGDVLIMNADHPLVEAETLLAMVAAHREAGAAATLLTFDRTETIGGDFGRIARGSGGAVEAIVELRDADDAQRALREVNGGYYVVRSDRLWSALDRVTDHNDQGELYLTDIVAILAGDGEVVHAHRHDDPLVAKGVNTRVDLAEADAELRARINRGHMLAGVTHRRSRQHVHRCPGSRSRPMRPCTRSPCCAAPPASVPARRWARTPWRSTPPSGDDALVGPFCYLRPGATLMDGAKAGTYVEIKNSVIGEGAKVPHLSYIGDADVGAG